MNPRDNQILAALTDDEYERVVAKMRAVPLELGETIYDQDQRVTHVFFPLSGAVALIVIMEDGSTVEPGIVGREGMLGFPIGLGDDRSRWRSVTQIEGEAMVMPRRTLLQHIREGGQLNSLITHYAGLLINLVAQSAACAQFHELRQRCSRWLLLMHDHAAGDEFPLTHEYLASMVGSRRPSVTVVLRELRDAGLVEGSRGKITILDRNGLEAHTCECYARIQIKYEELVDGTGETADGRQYDRDPQPETD